MLVRFKIFPEMLVRVNLGVAGFKSLPILHGFGSLWVFGMPVAHTNIASGMKAAKKLRILAERPVFVANGLLSGNWLSKNSSRHSKPRKTSNPQVYRQAQLLAKRVE